MKKPTRQEYVEHQKTFYGAFVGETLDLANDFRIAEAGGDKVTVVGIRNAFASLQEALLAAGTAFEAFESGQSVTRSLEGNNQFLLLKGDPRNPVEEMITPLQAANTIEHAGARQVFKKIQTTLDKTSKGAIEATWGEVKKFALEIQHNDGLPKERSVHADRASTEATRPQKTELNAGRRRSHGKEAA